MRRIRVLNAQRRPISSWATPVTIDDDVARAYEVEWERGAEWWYEIEDHGHFETLSRGSMTHAHGGIMNIPLKFLPDEDLVFLRLTCAG
jgi:hypothetical protein